MTFLYALLEGESFSDFPCFGCCSVAQSCATLCNPMGCNMPGYPVLHHSQNLLKLMSIELVMPSNHLIFCGPLLLLPSVFLSIRVFSNESVLGIRWPKYGIFNFSISPSNEYSGLISFRIDCLISLLSKALSRILPSTTNRRHQFFGAQPFLLSSSHICT